MSSGRSTEGASVSAVIGLIQRNPGLRRAIGPYAQARGVIYDRRFVVPYGAGANEDGSWVYIDEGVPLRFKMGIEPDRYTAGHEIMEWWLMTRRGLAYWEGPSPKSAHWWAEGYETMLLKLDGASDEEIEAYSAEWNQYADAAMKAEITPQAVPPDLYLGPYEETGDNDKREDADDKRILPVLRAARAGIVTTKGHGLD